MKTRIAKKKAKLYLDGKLAVPVFRDSWNIDTNGTYVVVDIAILHPKVAGFVLEEARRRGWSGCWWGDPTYLNIEVYNSIGVRIG